MTFRTTIGKSMGTLFKTAVAAVLLLAAAGSADADFMAGFKAYVNEDYQKALLEWTLSAAEGDARSMAYIGYTHFAGLGVPRDDTAALEWFERAAEHDDPDAIATMARMYAYGWGVDADMDKAFKLMTRVKDANNFAAQMAASEFYENAFGTEADLDKAIEHARRIPLVEHGIDLIKIRDQRIKELERKKSESVE